MAKLIRVWTLCLLLAMENVVNGVPPQEFIRQPHDQTAKVGDHVTLPCRVKNKRGMLQWTRDGFGLGVERNLTGFDRYHMSGIDEEGDYTLDIDPVLLEDDAVFQCQVGAADGVAPIRSRDAVLTVNVPPERPIIINGDSLWTTEDREVEIKCVSRGGKPAAEFTWLDGDGTTMEEGITSDTEEIENTKRITAISTLKLTVKKTHHNKSITCQAQNPAESSPTSVSIKLMVEYAPHVAISVDHSPVKEHESVTFTCNAHANPSEGMVYRWFIDNVIQPGKHGTTLKLGESEVRRQMNNKIVKCEVSNAIGKSEETETLDIHYDPEFVIKPQDVSGERGQDINLTCLVDGNPPPTYTWFRNGDMRHVYDYNGNLTLRIDESAVGKYVCRASVKGYREISASAEVFMKGPPRILNTQALFYGRVGSNVELTCDAFGIPPPRTIHWSNFGFSLPVHGSANDHFRLIEQPRKDGFRSKLIIRPVTEADFGDYNCTVENSHGVDSYIITLKEEQSLPLITILSAVIGGVLLTVAAILLMILCRRSSALTLRAMGNNSEKQYNGSSNASSKAMTTTGTSTSARSYTADPTVKSSTGNGTLLLDNEDWEPELSNEEGALLKSKQQQSNLANFQMDMGYPYATNPYGASYPPPPPPHANVVDPNLAFNGLNVTDPRYAAKYGNPYLRQQVPESPGRNYNFATLNQRQAYQQGAPSSPNMQSGFSTGQRPPSKKVNVNYTGTMVGNGKVSKNSGISNNQYIVSPDADAKADAMATHV